MAKERNNLGYFLQLRILLWKNLVHKIRSPFVLLVEFKLPLVLFFVLFCIRHRQPSKATPASYYRAKPLPSAGITAIMQAFCDGGYSDQYGFTHYPESTLTEFLSDLQNAAEHNNFFEPTFGLDEMDDLPYLYRSIIDDPASLHDAFKTAQDVQVSSIFTNTEQLKQELESNFSLPAVDVDMLLGSKINFTEVYRMLFGSVDMDSTTLPAHYRSKRSSSPNQHSSSPLTQNNASTINAAKSLADSFSSILNPHTALKTAMDLKEKYSIPANAPPDTIGDIVSKLKPQQKSSSPIFNPFGGVSNSDSTMSQDDRSIYSGLIYRTLRDNPALMTDPETLDVMAKLLGFDSSSTVISPVEIVDVLKKIFLTPENLKYMTCTPDEIERILIPQAENGTQELEDMAGILCNMTDDQWKAFSAVILQHASSQDIVTKLHLETIDFKTTHDKVSSFYQNIEEFARFEQNLVVLTKLATNLPNNTETCVVMPTPTPTVMENTTMTGNWTQDPTTEDTLHWKGRDETEEEEAESKKEHHRSKRGIHGKKYAGLLQIWAAMQATLCGKTLIPEENIDKFEKSGNADYLGLSKRQQNDLGLLIHVLYSNPKVLYAPNGTQADSIIQKANSTFALVDTISEYAHKWLNVSADIRSYLEKNTTAQNLDSIREMQVELRLHPELIKQISDERVREFIHGPDVPDPTFLLRQLDAVDKAACWWRNALKGISLNVFQGFATEEELVEYFLHEAYGDGVTVLASIVFDNVDLASGELPPHVIYRIRQNATFTQTTQRVRDKYWYPGPFGWDYRYYHYGFVWIQDIIERAIVDLHAGRVVIEPGSYIHEMPYPCYNQDNFIFMIEHVMPLCLTISWVYSVAMLVQSIVYEKEQRLKEVMKMMGLNNSVHWLAWFITAFSQMSVIMAILTVMLKYGHVLMYSNPWIIFIVLETFALATIAFSFLVSVCFSKAKVAAACAGIVYFLTYVPYMYVAIREEAAGDRISAWAKSIASLFSTTAFGLGAKYFAFYEIEGVGVQWDNLDRSPVEDDQYNLKMVMCMMLIDTLLYGVLTWYIEHVHPGSYGLPKPWYFPLTASYWCGGHPGRSDGKRRRWYHSCFRLPWQRRGRRGQGGAMYGDLKDEDDEEQLAGAMGGGEHGNSCNFEPEPSHLPLGVGISNLMKVYKNGKRAVNKLSLNLYEGQITSFLGHNGAGKTTTMSILTGMFPPTGGYATVYGLDIRTDMEEIRKSLGMCPQHNVLFEKFTVEEHLWFYARLKGMNTKDIKAEMDSMIEDIGLPMKRKNLVDCLSGGMKRKLSVAIAFVAGSRTVILDEPTAGVDPYARRDIWDLLIKYKEGRTILLSTHHMDEADLLGDRIAIVSHGSVRCCGSPLFLRSTFGEGYHLILVKKPSDLDIRSQDTMDENFEDESFQTRCSEEKVTEFIQKHVPTSYVKSESSQELHYILPFEGAKKGYFEKLFKAMDQSLDALEISSYGVVDTSLEEVFLKVTEQTINSPEDENESNQAKEQQGLDIGSKEPDDVPLLDAIPEHHRGTQRHGDQDTPSLLSGLSGNELISVSTDGPGLHHHQADLHIHPQPHPESNLHIHQPHHQLLQQGQGQGQGHADLLTHQPHNQPLQQPPLHQPPQQGHYRSASAGSLRDIIEDRPLISLEDGSAGPMGLQHAQGEGTGRVGRRTHARSPSDEGSLRGGMDNSAMITSITSNTSLNAAPTPTSPSSGMTSTPHRPHHKRTASDISLSTLAAIRGTYPHHKRTASDVSLRTLNRGGGGNHQRSPSDGTGSVTGSPLRTVDGTTGTAGTGFGGTATLPGHHRSDSTGTNSSTASVLLDAGGPVSPDHHMRDDISLLSAEERYNLMTGGRGSYTVSGWQLAAQQFVAVIFKRYYYVKRNWKGLFSQILLPALFVCIAMTVALTAPNVEDLPPLTLSPAQYYNYTQPRGNFIPFSNTGWEPPGRSGDAGPDKLIQTLHMPAGVGATCLLLSPFNSSFEIDVLRQINATNRDYHLVADYFQPDCQSVFVHGLRLKNFVPPPPTATPSVPPTTPPGNASNGVTPTLIPVTIKPAETRYFPICHCASDNSGQVCQKSGYEDPPSFQVVTNDILQDISGQDERDFYLYTTDIYRLHRYGGFSFGLPRHYIPENFGKDAPIEFRKLAVKHGVKVWFNHKGYHSIPVYINTLNNAILRANLPPEKGNPAAYGITAINHPMNDTNTVKSLEMIEQGSDVLIAIFIICAMSFVPASFVVYLVYEKSIKAKHLQFVSGMSRVIYWCANYIWDMFNYIIPAMCCIAILRGFNIPAYCSNSNFPAVVSLFFMYGWSITPMMYPASFWFEEPSTAYIALIVINLFIGITCIITSFLLEMFQQNDKDLQQVHETLKQVFLIFPNYCLGRGLIDIAFNQYRNDYFFKIGEYSQMLSPFEWKLMARNLAAMGAMGGIFFVITLLCEFKFFYRPRRMTSERLASMGSDDEDEDVAAERRRVMRGSGRRDMLRLTGLTKVYKTKKLGRHLAVDRLTLGVPQGECFGLLGVNGAGKTTTFKMLTGDLPPTGGNAMLNEYSILSNLNKVQQNIGYCPQFDALYDELTGREHLQLYARLRGVPWKEQNKVVEWALEKLALSMYADRLSGTYSGGNKRKLSTAIALIGHAPVIFMDEPTTGMDPHSRRFLWDLILDLIKEGRSVVLTSHSMEECEALCSRVAIMVNGRFKCLGSVQHLKNRFGDGYSLTVRVRGPNYERETMAVIRYVERHFVNSTHKGSHYNMLQFELSSINLSLSHVFATMEEACRELAIEDYSVSQNTLDNVFINFVEQQREIVQETELLDNSHTSSNTDSATSAMANNDLDLDDNDLPEVTSAGTRLAFLPMNVEEA